MTAEVASPCVGICMLDADAICSGCGRSLDEIAGWMAARDDERRAIVARAAARLNPGTPEPEPAR